MTKEIWKDVIGYEGCFMVSNLGKVKSIPRLRKNRFSYMKRPEIILTPCLDKRGYEKVCLSLNSKGHLMLVHRLVATAFLKNKENKRTVNHINGIKNDNRLVNLEWATDTEQIEHALRTGLRKPEKGVNNKKNISVNQLDINNNLIKRWFSVTEAERVLKIQHANIYKVLSGERKLAGGFMWSR